MADPWSISIFRLHAPPVPCVVDWPPERTRLCRLLDDDPFGANRPPPKPRMSPVRLQIVELLRAEGPLSARQVAERLGLEKASCQARLGSMKAAGVLARTRRSWRVA